MNFRLLTFSLLFMTSLAFASNDVINTQTLNTPSQNTLIDAGHTDVAKNWNLSESEWQQYVHLMQGTSGQYYKKLSPPEVLGINAETTEELEHYAEIAARLEHDKLARELRFNNAFHDAATRLYASEPIIKPFDYTSFTPISKHD